MATRFRIRKAPRMARCGRGCRKPNLDEMLHPYPEKLSGVSRSARRRAG